jgi:hypothetical protein
VEWTKVGESMKVKTDTGIEVEVTKANFEEYETVRMSGITNMFNVTMVEELTSLSREQIFAIMHEYEKLEKEFKVRNSEKLKPKALEL